MVKKGKLKIILLILPGVILIGVLSWIYLYYPLVFVEVTPGTDIVEEELTISASPQITGIDSENRILPLRKFEVTLTDEDVVRTTGKNYIGKTRAEGKVRFVNNREEKVTVSAGTRVENMDGVIFETVEDVVVPGVEVDYLMDVAVGEKAGQNEAGIRAVQEGSQGNVSTGTIRSMQEDISGIDVVNPEPTGGGEDKEVLTVSEYDVERLTEQLEQKVKSGLLTRIYRQLGGNHRVIEKDIDYSEVDLNFDLEVGERGEEVGGTATLVASGYLLPIEGLNSFTYNILRENMGEDNMLVGREFSVQEIRLAEKENGLYNVIMNVGVPVCEKVETGEIARALAGYDLEKAHDYLEKREDIKDFAIDSENSVLPGFSFAIRVSLLEPEDREVFQIYQ